MIKRTKESEKGGTIAGKIIIGDQQEAIRVTITMATATMAASLRDICQNFGDKIIVSVGTIMVITQRSFIHVLKKRARKSRQT